MHDFLEDERSKKVLISNLNAHITCDYLNLELDKSLVKYFQVDFKLDKGYKCLVNCGAYIGDSFEKILYNKECQHYIGFEPEPQNFIKLAKKCKDNKDKGKNITIYPLGVGNVNGFCSFESDKDSGSKISETGTDNIQIVRLDDILISEIPTFITMDIEGAEVDALNGAQEIIKKYKPDLAICVYHKISDLWEIPLLLKSLVPEYKLYLRSHDIATTETVLYATI